MNVNDKVLYQAIKFAVKAHKKHKRKNSGAPYIIHPMVALSYLYETKASKNMNLLATCMILHDVVEDTDTKLSKIRKKFGYYVAAIVEELSSNPEELAKVGKTEYLKTKMQNMSSYALVLKLCDRLHNIIDRTTYDSYMSDTYEIIRHLMKVRALSVSQNALIVRMVDLIKKVKEQVC